MALMCSLIGLTGVLAAPAKSPGNVANTATCSVDLTSTNHDSAMANYSVHINRPYINGAGCSTIKQTLMGGVKIGVYEYQCFTSDDGASTNLSFVSATGPSTNVEVVDSVQKAYQMIPFQKERICLMESVDATASWPDKKVKRDPGFFDDLGDYLEWMGDSVTGALGITDDDKKAKRLADSGDKQPITPDVDAYLHHMGVVERSSGTNGLSFGDLNLDEETVDRIIEAHRVANQEKQPRKRDQDCDIITVAEDCDYNPKNRTCMMTTGCHDGEVPATNTAMCFDRVGGYDVRIGKPHLDCIAAEYIQSVLWDKLKYVGLASANGGRVDFNCHEGPDDTTNLVIGVPNVWADLVNEALDKVYPGVGFNNGICPKCTNLIDGGKICQDN